MTTVISNASSDTPAIGGLFAGSSFFLVQRVPSRSHYVAQIQANGGRVVKIENQADYVIADHLRKDAPAGSISFKFIEASIEAGELANPEEHSAGPAQGTIREPGSIRPAKATRKPFTMAEDQQLWDWVEECRQNGLPVKGNEIYKDMEKMNPSHPFQAWRDRYIKKLLDNPRPEYDPNQPATTNGNSGRRRKSKLNMLEEVAFTQADFDAIMEGAEAIYTLSSAELSHAWDAWAEANTDHTAEEWKYLWNKKVKPAYIRRLKENEQAESPEEDEEREEHEAAQNGEQAHEENPSKENSPKENTPKENTPEENAPSKLKRKRATSNEEPPAGDNTDKNDDENSNSHNKKRNKTVFVAEYGGLKHVPHPPIVQRGTAPQSTAPHATAPHATPPQETGQRVTAPHVTAQHAAAARHAAARHATAQRAIAHMRSGLNQGNVIQDGVLATAKQGLHGDRLTEANLASQQAQHRGQLLRGADLPADDEQNDQSEFIEYLQGTLKQPVNGTGVNGSSNALNNVPGDMDFFADGASDLGVMTTVNDDHIGDPFEWALEPESTLEKEAESNDLPFDENADYSTLTASQKAEYDRVFSSQPFRSQGFEVSQFPEQSLDPTPRENGDHADSGESTPRANGHHNGDEENDIDLTLPEPEGGFGLSSQQEPEEPEEHEGNENETNGKAEKAGDDEISSSPPSSNSLPPLPADSRKMTIRKSKPVETQDIVDAETQMPDFDMPLPPDPETNSLDSDYFDEEDDDRPLPTKKSKSTPKKDNDPPSEPEDVEAFMDRMKMRLGYDDDAVIDALEHTSMRPQLAELLLLHQKTGKNLPVDVQIRGVWTNEEDEILESGDARGLRGLTERFGWPECESRMKFLEQWRGS